MSVFAASKKFAVVSFNNGTVEVIPASWLMNEYQTKWPDSDVYSQNTVIKFIKQCKPPEESWGTFHGVKIYCYTKTFSTANKIANAVKESSNAGSDSSENDKDTPKKRKIKKPQRYLSASSSEDENGVPLKENTKKRKFSISRVSTSKDSIGSVNGENRSSSELNSDSKKFAVVSFKNDTIEIIPASWLINDSKTKWPDSDAYSQNTVIKYIKQCKPPKQSWETFDVNIYCYTKTFSTANKIANAIKESSNTGSDSSENDRGRGTMKRRKVKKPQRYLNESTSEEENENNVRLKKIFKKRKFSSPRVSTSKESIRANGENGVFESLASSSDLSSERTLVSKRKDVKSENDSDLHAMFKQILEGITRIEERTKNLETLYGDLNKKIMNYLSISDPIYSHTESFQLPDGIIFPLTSDKELLNFNSKLNKDQDLKTKLIRYLHSHCRGRSLSSYLKSVLKMLIIKDVAILYSRLGRKGKKSFEDLKEVFELITVAASLKFSSPKEEISEKFGKVLATSAEWDKPKPEKLYYNSKELTENNGPCSQ